MIEENRKKVVLAMEMLARCINDEDVFEGWLMNGVAMETFHCTALT